MKIERLRLNQFKRFTELTIKDIPAEAKLVVLVGPNGCGKSSLFDAFKAWHLYRAYGYGIDNDYYNKDMNNKYDIFHSVNIYFHDIMVNTIQRGSLLQQAFYFRTAYRNSPKISIDYLQSIPSPLDNFESRMMIENDATVDENYQRLLSATISKIYNQDNNDKTVHELRDELISMIREPLHRLFPDLLFTELGVVPDKAEFYFEKGITHHYGYEKLSGGEKLHLIFCWIVLLRISTILILFTVLMSRKRISIPACRLSFFLNSLILSLVIHSFGLQLILLV